MRAETTRQKGLILAATMFAIAGVLAVKHRAPRNLPGGAEAVTACPAVILFLNEADQDEGCRRMYSLFDGLKSSLPLGVSTARVDAKGNEARLREFGVRVLPTILFINRLGTVTARIEGEGDEAESQFRASLSKAPALLAQ